MDEIGRNKAEKGSRGRIGDVDIWCVYDEIVALEDLKPNPQNPNIHPAVQIELLADIIENQGWRNPITVSNRSGFIVRGHGRLYAAVKKGFTHAPVDFQDYESDEAEIADLIADNKIAELAIIDEDLANELLKGLQDVNFDLSLTGFDPGELDFGGESDASASAEAKKPEIEFTPEIMLEHNYIILYFDNPFDWQVAVDKFGLKMVKDLIPRKGQPTGIGRVVNGAAWLDRIK